MSAFTPGPWLARATNITLPDGIILAFSATPEDAQLIAAAPDLLAALETFMTEGVTLIPRLSGHYRANVKACVDKAKAAIDKATAPKEGT